MQSEEETQDRLRSKCADAMAVTLCTPFNAAPAKLATIVETKTILRHAVRQADKRQQKRRTVA